MFIECAIDSVKNKKINKYNRPDIGGDDGSHDVYKVSVWHAYCKINIAVNIERRSWTSLYEYVTRER